MPRPLTTRHTLLGLALILTIGAGLEAQISTATVQGKVSDATGVLPGVTVTARETQSGFTHDAVTGADGYYTLAGLRPGTYEIRVTMDQYKPQARTVQVLVGQSLTVDFAVSPDVTYTETVQVVSERLTDTRTTEVSTNVTQEQIQHLPQNSRNFLNFAALAPGLRVSDNELRKEFSAGALPSQNVNVFIDGVSYKNDVIDGGVVGQDASRGNPFPQNAVRNSRSSRRTSRPSTRKPRAPSSPRSPRAAPTGIPATSSASTRTRAWSRTRSSCAIRPLSSS